MSQFRHKWQIVVDGKTHTVITTARDMRAMQLDFSKDEPVMSPVEIMLVIHAALVRTGVEDVPSDPDEFLDLVDDIDDLEPGAGIVMDPTPKAPSGG